VFQAPRFAGNGSRSSKNMDKVISHVAAAYLVDTNECRGFNGDGDKLYAGVSITEEEEEEEEGLSDDR
jgi:hypothetical protein